MNKLKRYYIMPYLLVCLVATIHSLVMLVRDDDKLAWFGSLLAIAPMLGFMLYLVKSGRSTTPRYMPLQLSCAAVGTLIAWYEPRLVATSYATVVGLAGVSLYIFWYSRLGRSTAHSLSQGEQLPAFELIDSSGEAISSKDFCGSPTLLLFYRGNWCPLCVAQVQQLSAQYRELAELGIKVVLISPQPQSESEALSKRFDAPMRFAVDIGGSAARRLGLLHPAGVPAGISGYDRDTVYPTMVLCDADNQVLWSDQSDNYRVRPEPETFLAVARQHLAAKTGG